jgi:hypothetical protein
MMPATGGKDMALAAYYRLKWGVAAGSFTVAAVVALLLVPFVWFAGLALLIGTTCGIANMLGIMRGSERLVETRSAVFFGLSSLPRLAAFSIVAAADLGGRSGHFLPVSLSHSPRTPGARCESFNGSLNGSKHRCTNTSANTFFGTCRS